MLIVELRYCSGPIESNVYIERLLSVRAAASSASFSVPTGFAGVFRLRNARPDGAEGTDRLAVDGRIAPPHPVRTVVVGNCGKLLAELVLMPAARCEDVEHGRDT